MENQIGCVLVFKPGVDPTEIRLALNKLENLVDTSYHVNRDKDSLLVKTTDGRGTVTRLNKFNPDHGGPVWYVP